MVGSCQNYLLRCPMCGRVFGGVALDGIRRYCQECPYNGLCRVEDITNADYKEEVCGDNECNLQWILYQARLKGLNI